RIKRPSEKIFLFLVIGVGIWHCGNLLSLTLRSLAHGEWTLVAEVARSIAFIGLASFPALLVHTHVAFLRESESNLITRLQKVLLAIMYAPLVYFIYPLTQVLLNENAQPFPAMAQFMLPYVCWFVTAMILSAMIDMRLARIQEDEPFRHFYRVIGYTFLFIAVLTTFTYILGGREFPQLRSYLEILSIVAS